MSVSLFIQLLTAHLIADYPLQGEFLAQNKGNNLLLMITHCIIWAGLLTTVISLNLKLSDSHFIGVFLMLGSIHYAIDVTKCFFSKLFPNQSLTVLLWIDQLLHVGQIVSVLYLIK